MLQPNDNTYTDEHFKFHKVVYM